MEKINAQTGQITVRRVAGYPDFDAPFMMKGMGFGLLLDRNPLDWGPLPRTGILAILNGLYSASLPVAAELAGWAGRDDLAQRWSRQQHLLAAEFPKVFRDEERGYFCDVPVEEKKAAFSQQAQAAAVFGGMIEKKAGASLLMRAASDSALIPVEAYFSYFWIDAMTRSGLEMEALRFIRWRWGTMVDEGATLAWKIWKRVSGYTHVGYRHNAIASWWSAQKREPQEILISVDLMKRASCACLRFAEAVEALMAIQQCHLLLNNRT